MFGSCIQTLTHVVFTCVVLRIAWGFYKFITIYCMGSYPDFGKYGKWSVVTGATDGIGLAFARKLAELGQNIVVVSRTSEKVKSVATELSEKYNVETKEIVVDFSCTDIYDKIKCDLEGLDVGLLVNNVGVGMDLNKHLDFAAHEGEVEKMIKVNALSVVKMTGIVLPQMIGKHKGIILNISSGSGVVPTPMISLYSATKHFVDSFSKCIDAEYGNKGIISQCIMPFFVATKMSKIKKTNFLVVSPDAFVASALKVVGKCRRSFGCLSHALQGKLFEILPEAFGTLFFKTIFERAKKKRSLF